MKPIRSITYQDRGHDVTTLVSSVSFDNRTHWGCGRCGHAHERTVQRCPGMPSLEDDDLNATVPFEYAGRYLRG